MSSLKNINPIDVTNIFNILSKNECHSYLSNNNDIFIKNYDKDLTLYSHKKCSNDSEMLIKKNRGSVYNKDCKLVAPSFGYTQELNEEKDLDEIKKIFEDCKNKIFMKSYEGTLVRLYNYNEKWYISTHRKLDAFKSRWSSSSSFGHIFVKGLVDSLGKKYNEENQEKVFEKFVSTLDKNSIYFFILCSNKDNKVLTEIDSNIQKVLDIGMIYNYRDDKYYYTVNEDISLEKPEIYKFNSYKDIIEHVKNCNYKETQGLFVIDDNFNTYKVVNNKYKELSDKKIAEYKLKYGYLRVRNNEEDNNKYNEENKQHNMFFKDIESSIFELAKKLFLLYKRRYIKKEMFYTSKEIHNVLKNCHRWHKDDYKQNIVNMNTVINNLNQIQPYFLIKMI
jgi:hypothetical protein